jgi:hypothetical protein
MMKTDANPLRSKSVSELPGVDREFAILVACARVRIGAGEPGDLQELTQQGLDWNKVIQLALAHRLVPTVYHALRSAESVDVPAEVLQWLQSFSFTNAGRCLNLVRDLTSIVTLLGEAGIPALPFKGPMLAALVYGDVAARHAGDLDILVHPEDVTRACEIICAQGYGQPDQIYDQSRPFLRDSRFLESAASLAVYNLISEKGIVELHWQFTYRSFRFPLEASGLWTRLQTACIGGVEVNHFAPEDLLLLLCGHGNKETWTRLSWVCDVAEAIRVHPDLDWDRAQALASHLGGSRMLHVGLLLAHNLIGADVPAAVMEMTRRDAGAVRLAAHVCWQLPREINTPTSPRQTRNFYVQVRERARDRYYTLAQLLFTPTEEDWRWCPLPLKLSTLYHILRPVRLLTRTLGRGSNGRNCGGEADLGPTFSPLPHQSQ